MTITFILGGADSGKSVYAENLANKNINNYEKKIYLATAPAIDVEMKRRIKLHQKRRDDSWVTIEEEVFISRIIEEKSSIENILLIECLTTWLSNMVYKKIHYNKELKVLTNTLYKQKNDIIIVSNELGHSIIPENKLSREFRTINGKMNQAIAKIADNVIFVIAGYGQKIK
jgi:adenosylcobinamide kinase / adenosylcobinamide-phosphate guanylyltransferase